MKRLMMAIIALTVVGSLFTSCKKDETPQNTVITKTDSLSVNFSSTKTFAFFNFKNGAVVPNSDSATVKWDFGLRFTTFILNSNAYGPGNAGAILQNTLYANVTEAPATGYAYDTTTSKKGIKDGSWYNYNPSTRSFSPKAGQTFFFRTADNFYVKMELLAVDYGPFTGPQPDKLIYRFRYTFQSNGSTKF
jgi:hypothetical protein